MQTQTINPTNVDQILVAHDAYLSAEKRIINQILAAREYYEPTCIALVGESRTGKSRLAGSILRQFPEEKTLTGRKVPVLCVKTPSKPTVKGLVEILLRELGDPMCYKRESENEKTERLYKLIKQAGVHTIIIDEFQHFYDKVSHKVQHYLSDWLKIFVDNTGLTLFVVGLPSCMAVINQNEQLRGRFMSAIHMRRFDWESDHDREEFVACLVSFIEALSYYQFPGVTSDIMAFRFYCATGGLIGYIAKILHQSCLNANVANTNEISLADLARAFDEAVWIDSINGMPNPFLTDIQGQAANYLLLQAKQIGAVSGDATFMESTTQPSRTASNAGEVLVA